MKKAKKTVKRPQTYQFSVNDATGSIKQVGAYDKADEKEAFARFLRGDYEGDTGIMVFLPDGKKIEDLFDVSKMTKE